MKLLKTIIVLGIFIALQTNSKLFGDTINICSTCPITSIKSALALATDGDVILLKPGTYKEGKIIINKSIQLLGIGFPVIDGEHQTEIIVVDANNIRLAGLQIQNVGTSYIEDRAAIKVNRKNNCIIEKNRIYDAFFGVYLKYAKDCKIRDNEIIGKALNESSSGNGIHLWYSKRVLIERNIIKNHRDGIYLEFVDSTQVLNNVSIDNLRYGLHFMFSNDDDYKHNIFKTNGAGVAVMFSKNIKMINNQFINNWGGNSYGLLLKEIYDAEISGNQFTQNTIGIYGESATRVVINKNTFSNNGWALKILGSSMDNTITQNNFFSNSFNLSTNTARNYNNYDGNYWSEYTGYDLNRDGIGDIPYRPVNLYSYIVTNIPESLVLLRSSFIDLLNLAEKITPVLSPVNLFDYKPLMKPLP